MKFGPDTKTLEGKNKVLIIACKQSISSAKKRFLRCVQCPISQDGILWCFLYEMALPHPCYTNPELSINEQRSKTHLSTRHCLHFSIRETITSLCLRKWKQGKKELFLTYLFWTRCAFLPSCINTVRSCSVFIRLQNISLCQHEIICKRGDRSPLLK